MKAKELIEKCCTYGVKMQDLQVVTINEQPLEDCTRLFGDFNSCILPRPGSYLAEWVDADRMPVIGNPDAILVLDDVKTNGLVHLYRIDD